MTKVRSYVAAATLVFAHLGEAFFAPGGLVPTDRGLGHACRQQTCSSWWGLHGGADGRRAAGEEEGAMRMSKEVADASMVEEKRHPVEEQTQRGHFYGFGDPDHVPSILQNITAQRYLDVAEARQEVSEATLRKQIDAFQKENGKTVDLFRRVVAEEPDMAIAAEFKRASPSKGDIAVGVNAGEQGSLYASVGATVLSVLTEPRWFKGSLEDMKEVRLATQDSKEGKAKMRPAILRKDFIVDEYQLLEARANGADSVLLIVAVLEVDRLDDLIDACRALDMEPLVEVHTDEEMKIALRAGARVIGVNNRNLHTFELDLQTTERVACVAVSMGVPWQSPGQTYNKERIVLSALSGIKGPEDVERFSVMGVSMVLVGETLMRADDPARAIETLLGRAPPQPVSEKHLVKVCGVTSKEDALAAAAAGANLIGVIFAEGSPRRVTVERANEIAKAVQAFGERKTPMVLEPPAETDSSAEWYQAWAKTLVEASQRTPLVVGVFQNQPTDEIQRVVVEASLDLVQLHGDEGIEACADCGVPALRVVHVPAAEAATGGEGTGQPGLMSAEARAKVVLEQLPPGYAAGVVLDTTVGGAQGGTGATFDHEVAKLVGAAGVPVIVAGGLNPNNVAVCVAMTSSYGVDVSSGVEETKGVKNVAAVEKFLSEARDAQAGLKTKEAEEDRIA